MALGVGSVTVVRLILCGLMLVFLCGGWYFMHRTKGEGYLIPFLVGFVYSSVLAVATIVGMGRESFVSERVSLLLSLYSLAVALTGCGLLYWAYRRKPRDSQHWARLFTRAGVATLISVVMLVL